MLAMNSDVSRQGVDHRALAYLDRELDVNRGLDTVPDRLSVAVKRVASADE
jgi:hypothetical protein